MAKKMSVKIEDGAIVITLPMQTPEVSKSGKSQIVATTNGFVHTDASVAGKTVSVSINCIIPR